MNHDFIDELTRITARFIWSLIGKPPDMIVRKTGGICRGKNNEYEAIYDKSLRT
jgi:hypothetical protein